MTSAVAMPVAANPLASEYPTHTLRRNEATNVAGSVGLPATSIAETAMPAGGKIGVAYPGGIASINPNQPVITYAAISPTDARRNRAVFPSIGFRMFGQGLSSDHDSIPGKASPPWLRAVNSEAESCRFKPRWDRTIAEVTSRAVASPQGN